MAAAIKLTTIPQGHESIEVALMTLCILHWFLGGLLSQTSNACFILQADGKWSSIKSMNKNRRFSATVSTMAFGVAVIGGESDSKTKPSSIEHFMGDSWKELPGAKLKVSRHCAVSLNGIDVFIIGGHLEDQPFSDRVFLLSTKTNNIRPLKGSSMKRGRQFHACSNFDKDSIIVVGGRNYQGLLQSVEVFNLRTLMWTEPTNLQLSIGIAHAQLILDIKGLSLKWCP